MAWIYLIIAGMFEWGWPLGFKLAWTDKGASYGWIIFSVISMAASGAFLFLAQKTIPMGTAYAVWTGVGAVGTFFIGILIFSESAALLRFFFVGMIIAGILGLKLSSVS
ncbi:MAG: multidrug efflux SMR transporter [Desulfobulbaceae bacterium]|nr:multidrug efflux SMR transporter [Desulfobulbaceae bacterium]